MYKLLLRQYRYRLHRWHAKRSKSLHCCTCNFEIQNLSDHFNGSYWLTILVMYIKKLRIIYERSKSQSIITRTYKLYAKGFIIVTTKSLVIFYAISLTHVVCKRHCMLVVDD